MKVSINRIAAFLMAITYSTFAFALDCNAVRELLLANPSTRL